MCIADSLYIVMEDPTASVLIMDIANVATGIWFVFLTQLFIIFLFFKFRTPGGRPISRHDTGETP